MRDERATWWGARATGVLAAALALAPAAPDEADEALRAAGLAKIRAAAEVLDIYREYLSAPPGENNITPRVEAAEQIQSWSRTLAEARLEAAATRDERIRLLTEETDRAREFETQVRNLAAGEGMGLTRMSTAKASYYRAEAEARLARARTEK